MKNNNQDDNKVAVTLSNPNGLGLFKLTAFAIGTTLASRVFSVSTDLAANGAGTLAVLIGWAIAGIGMYALAMCFYRLSVVRPDLQSGIFSYAREGFGVIISIGGAMFSYTILTADCAYAPAKLGCFPKYLARENKNGAPVAALLTTTIIVQIFLIIVYFQEYRTF